MDVFAALADPVRRRLLLRLSGGPARVVDLAAEEEISRPGVSKHLRLLGEAGLVGADARGRERHYRLEPEVLRPVAELLASLRAPEAVGPRFAERDLAGLDLEVRRTVRDRATGTGPAPGGTHHLHEEDSA